MASGGARANSGPARDPNSLRSAKLTEKGGVRLIPRVYAEPAPEWPLVNPSPRETELWTMHWTKPQAIIWAAQGSEFELAIHIRTLSEAELPGVQANRRTLLLQQMNSLMLTEATLSKAGYKIADSAEAVGGVVVPASKRSSRPSSRGRLTAVPNADPNI